MPVKDVEKREAFMNWLTTPADEREIKTETGFAQSINTPRGTLHRWKNDWRFAAEVQNRLSRHLDIAELPDVMASLLISAKDPSSPRQVPAANALLSYVKWNLERTEEVVADIRSFTDDELREMMMAALDVIDERERTDPS